MRLGAREIWYEKKVPTDKGESGNFVTVRPFAVT